MIRIVYIKFHVKTTSIQGKNKALLIKIVKQHQDNLNF